MKIFLDDMRKPPFGWDRVMTADACIEALQEYGTLVEELSLDHDLHEEHYDTSRDPRSYKHKTGFAVVDWIVTQTVWPSVIYVHSLNRERREAMVAKLVEHAPAHVRILNQPRIV